MYACVDMLTQWLTVDARLLSLVAELQVSNFRSTGACGCITDVCYQHGPPVCA